MAEFFTGRNRSRLLHKKAGPEVGKTLCLSIRQFLVLGALIRGQEADLQEVPLRAVVLHVRGLKVRPPTDLGRERSAVESGNSEKSSIDVNMQISF